MDITIGEDNYLKSAQNRCQIAIARICYVREDDVCVLGLMSLGREIRTTKAWF